MLHSMKKNRQFKCGCKNNKFYVSWINQDKWSRTLLLVCTNCGITIEEDEDYA